jgi:hypothetical protein
MVTKFEAVKCQAAAESPDGKRASKDFALIAVVIVPAAKIKPVQRLKILLWSFCLTKTMGCKGQNRGRASRLMCLAGIDGRIPSDSTVIYRVKSFGQRSGAEVLHDCANI